MVEICNIKTISIINKKNRIMTENQLQTRIQKWVIIYLWVATVMALMFSVLAYIKPDIQFGAWEAFSVTGALSLAGPVGLYISRNLATVFAGIYALTHKSVMTIKVLLILRLFTDGLDFVHNAVVGNLQGGAFALIMFIIEAVALFSISKKWKN